MTWCALNELSSLIDYQKLQFCCFIDIHSRKIGIEYKSTQLEIFRD